MPEDFERPESEEQFPGADRAATDGDEPFQSEGDPVSGPERDETDIPEEASDEIDSRDVPQNVMEALTNRRYRRASPASTGSVQQVDDGPDHRLPFLTVGIGASAGGLEAYRELFENTPPETGMCFVLITHLAPDKTSSIVEILSRATPIQVETITHGTRAEPNHLYVMPPNFFATIRQGLFALEPRPGGPRGSFAIDHFLRSLAADQKDHALGVILSGADGDGALGLKAIKEEGGFSIVQAPETARFGSMPRSSIEADHIDLILPPKEIAAELAEIASRFDRGEQLAPPEAGDKAAEKAIGRILMMLKTVAGIDFHNYRFSTVWRRMSRRMMLKRIDGTAAYLRYLQQQPSEVQLLHEDVLIHVTQFFRDPDVFQFLKASVFPQILANRPLNRPIRIWVAGCATGEEVYSVAISLLEYLSSQAVEPPIQIFGTDASDLSIERARSGQYPASIVADVSSERLRRYFIQNDKGFQISKRVRDLCVFARQNLCNDPPFSKMDLISCRNVLIYFEPPLQREVIATFHYGLNPGGFLLLGHSEGIRDFEEYFHLQDRRHRLYTKVEGPERPRFDFVSRYHFQVDEPPRTQPWGDYELQRAADQTLLAHYGPPAGVVINERFEILQSRGQTAPFVEMLPGAASLNLFRMVQPQIAVHLRVAVEQVIREDKPAFIPAITVTEGERVREASVEILPITNSGGGRERTFLILFRQPKRLMQPETPADEAGAVEPAEGVEPSDAERDLQSTRLHLKSLVEERDARNHELISANEEIQSANEELQSTNEELETTKEELQSANEELQTVNEELQQRNAALAQTTNDLSNLLNSVNLPVLMLDNDLRVRQFTPPLQRLINVRLADIGRPIGEIKLNLADVELEQIGIDVLDTLTAREIEVLDRDGRWFQLRVRPYRTSENKIEGVVVILLDIDQLRKSNIAMEHAKDFAQQVIQTIAVPLVLLNVDFRVRIANPAFEDLSKVGVKEAEGLYFPALATSLWGLDLQQELEEVLESPSEVGAGIINHATHDGVVRHFRLTVRQLRSELDRVLLVSIEDKTAQVNAEQMFELEKQEFRYQLESTEDVLRRTRSELRALTGGLFESSEEEGRRVARELHDVIIQRVVLLEMKTSDIEKSDASQETRNAIADLRAGILELLDQIRQISQGLHPAILEDLGLVYALRELVEEFGHREQLPATFTDRDIPADLPREVQIALYRIAQEALWNASKYAGKTHIRLNLELSGRELRMEVIDLGEGFDMNQMKRGLGMVSMTERARMVGGTVKVQSSPGRGTSVSVVVPLEDRN